MTLTAAVDVRRGALHLELELTVTTREVVTVVGPNGAGKTTLLRVLAGLQPLDAGHVALDQFVLDDPKANVLVEPEQRSVGLVFQDGLLFPHLGALDNVAFGLRSRGVPRRIARQRAGDWLARVGLDNRERARPGQLSGGEAQRVALARALAPEPRMLLLDEPLGALDVTARLEVRHQLRRHLASYEGIRVLVTHDPLEALTLGSRVVVLEDGRITHDGAPDEVRARPRSRYAADLVGVNLLRGTRRAGHEIGLPEGGRVTVADRVPATEVLAVVHPRAIALHRVPPEGSSPRNLWPATVASLDQEGDRVRARLDGPVALVAEVTPGAARELDLVEGAPVWASVKATEVSVYPA